jgi:hypothetical protein
MSLALHFDIQQRIAFAGGHAFGDTGAYERLSGRVHFQVDPLAPPYAGVVDLDRAPRDAGGHVHFASDLCILRPVDPARGNRRLFFGYGNRGNKRELQFFNDAPAGNDPLTLADAGNGFLMRRGYTVVWAAWEGDLLPGDGRMVLDVPVASDGGEPITGPVRTEFIANAPGVTTMPLSGSAATISYPTVSMDPGTARLTRRRYPGDAPEAVASDAWRFARLEAGMGLDGQGAQSALVPSAEHIHLSSGFTPGWIYELVYTARDPRVMGLGHVVVRDLVSCLKHQEVDAAGQPNPVGEVEKAYAWGRSQTGRAIRDFIHGGWNVDADGKAVFDGVLPHVSGGGLMWMNHRFARVVNPAGQQYEDHHNCADRFPFSYAESRDHNTGVSDAICKRPDTDPLILHTQTATEYWQRKGSLVHTDTHGDDLPQPDNVRVYLWSSSQHFADPNLGRPGRGVCQEDVNVVRTSMLFRAMLDALDAWASHGVAPPPSRVPRREDGTLVDAARWLAMFPRIPGAALPRAPCGLDLLDFGADFSGGLLTQEPPRVVREEAYTVLVPAVDEDGNEVAGVRAPMVQVPLATYTGWALRRRGFGHGGMFEFQGSTLPFPQTESEREQCSDPRCSVQARYGDRAGYQRAIEAAARTLVSERLMLEEDVERAVQAAANWSAPRHEVDLP